MKLTVLSLLSSPLIAAGTEPHPVEGVIDLLKNLKDQVKTAGQTEEVTYSKFAKWCKDSGKTLSRAVATSKEDIEELEPEIESLTEENTTLTEDISRITDEIGNLTQANTDADTKRSTDNGLYTTADGDFGTAIQAFDDVITGLETARDNADSASLVQSMVRALPTTLISSLPPQQVSLLSMLNSSSSSTTTTTRPELLASGDYKDAEKKIQFRSGNIVELLKDLKAATEDQRVEATKAETAAVNAHNLAKDARTNAITAAGNTKSAKERRQGDCQSDLGTAEGSLTTAKSDLAADEGVLETTKKDCMMKQTEWEERQATRAHEQKALDAGIKILAKVSGVRTEKPTNPVPPAPPADAPASTDAPDASTTPPFPTGFLQIDAQPGTESDAKAVNLLRMQAKRHHSKSFRRFVQELENKLSGPFDEVNDMIQKMIFRLMAEQKDEDDHKNWCDLELSKTEASSDNKNQTLTQLGLKLTAARADTGSIAQAITNGNTMISKINDFIAEATEIRNDGKKENKEAIGEAKEASNALAKAIAVLSDFYKETGMMTKEDWEFVQRNKAPVTLPADPATWDQPYTGVADPKNPGGVITVLETIASDFATMEAETKAQEATDETNYQEEMKTQEIEKARRTKEVEMKTQEQQRLNDKIASLEKNEKRVKEEKEALDQYLKDLEPACVEGDSTYEDRKKARDDEIEALKEAQVILADPGNTTNATDSGASGGGAFLAQIRRV